MRWYLCWCLSNGNLKLVISLKIINKWLICAIKMIVNNKNNNNINNIISLEKKYDWDICALVSKRELITE
jgi:hypothetical protein